MNARRLRTGLTVLRALWVMAALWLFGFGVATGVGANALLVVALVTALGVLVATPPVVSRISRPRRCGAEAPKAAGTGRAWLRQAGAVLRRLRATRAKADTEAETEMSTSTKGERRLPGLDPL